jgi:hypothetical protein
MEIIMAVMLGKDGFNQNGPVTVATYIRLGNAHTIMMVMRLFGNLNKQNSDNGLFMVK